MKNLLLIFLVVSLGSLGLSAQNPGALDLSFDSVGFRRDATNDTIEYSVIEVMQDGRIVSAGVSGNGPQRFIHIFRYLTDGQLDTSFAQVGHLITGDYVVESDDIDMTLQADGKILVYYQAAGTVHTFNTVGRLNVDGTMDASFGNGGWVMDSTNDPIGYPCEILVQADGKILLVGFYEPDFLPYGFYAQRLLPDGMPDMAYGTAGSTLLQTTGDSQYCFAARLQPDGKLLIAGFTNDTVNFFETDPILGRLETNGSPDLSFGTNGFVHNTSVPSAWFASDVLIGTQGEIYLATENPNASNGSDLNLMQFTSNGTLNTNFGAGGWMEIADSPQDIFPVSLKLQSDGGIIILCIGQDVSGAPSEVPNLFRLLPNHTLDPNFGINGLSNPIISNLFFSPTDLALQPDGKILVAGTSAHASGDWRAMTLGRYHGSLPLAAESALAAATVVELYPNPNAGLAQLRLTLPENCEVAVRLNDMLGRAVAQPIAPRACDAGMQVMTLDMQALPAGTYLLQVQTDAHVQTERMIVTH